MEGKTTHPVANARQQHPGHFSAGRVQQYVAGHGIFGGRWYPAGGQQQTQKQSIERCLAGRDQAFGRGHRRTIPKASEGFVNARLCYPVGMNPDHPNAARLVELYAALGRRDAGAMATLYHRRVRFSDPVFTDLDYSGVTGMWAMLCARGKDLVVEASGISADENAGVAHWEAWYTFSATGRKVHNIIDAEFRFEDGLIIEHRDRFDFWRWSRQALGPVGTLLGWSPLVQNKVRSQAASGLAAFMTAPGKPS